MIIYFKILIFIIILLSVVMWPAVVFTAAAPAEGAAVNYIWFMQTRQRLIRLPGRSPESLQSCGRLHTETEIQTGSSQCNDPGECPVFSCQGPALWGRSPGSTLTPVLHQIAMVVTRPRNFLFLNLIWGSNLVKSPHDSFATPSSGRGHPWSIPSFIL